MMYIFHPKLVINTHQLMVKNCLHVFLIVSLVSSN